MDRRLLIFAVFSIAHVAGATDHEAVYYWNGQHKVRLELALNELEVTANDPLVNEQLTRALPDVTQAKVGHRVRLSFNGLDRAALLRRAEVATNAGSVPRAVFYPSVDHQSPDTRQVLTDRLALRLKPGQDFKKLAGKYGLVIAEVVSYSPNTWIVKAPGDALAALEIANRLYEAEAVVFASPLLEHALALRGGPSDPLYAQQWHLKNTGQLGAGTAGNDINVEPVWNYTTGIGLGADINIAIVDSGVQTSHPDLAANCRTLLDTDLLTPDDDPNPESNAQFHGSAVAGMAAARDSNGVGGVGVAPRAGIIGVRLISEQSVLDNQEADAMRWKASETDIVKQVHVSNNSWGVPDDGESLGSPGALMNAALLYGVTTGRSNKGIVYVWAGGNGYGNGDAVDYDGYANSPYVIAVAASRHDGNDASYSEGGACVLINAPGGDGGGKGVTTTDMVGSGGDVSGDYFVPTDTLAGTSFAAPIVSGVVALMLEANPRLTWRDAKHILVRTAVKNDPTDTDWLLNHAAVPRAWSYYHGFGRVDASAVVSAARSWTNVPQEATPVTASDSPAMTITDNGAISRTCNIIIPGGSSGFLAEVVELHVNISHALRGQLSFLLTSPKGTVVPIDRRPLDQGQDYDWTFTSVATWGEDPAGTWTLQVFDKVSGTVGTLNSWGLTVHGYAPHQAPVFSGVTPVRIGEDQPDKVITVTGSGFLDGVTQVRWGATDLATTWTSTTQVSAVVPASLLTTPGVVSVTAVNPDFEVAGSAHIAVASGTVTIDAKPTFAGVPATMPMTEDMASSAIPFTIADDFTAVGSLTLTAASSNQSVVANAGLALMRAGANCGITITPLPNATGSTTITLTLGDGYGLATTLIIVTVANTNDLPVALDGVFELRPGQMTGHLSGYDVDVPMQSLTASISPLDAAVVIAGTGDFTYTPTPGFTGLASFTWHLSDGVGFSPLATATLVVNADPSFPRPSITSQPDDEIIAQGDNWNYSVTVDASAYIGIPPTFTYELAGAPSGMSVAFDGTITWLNPQPPGSGNHISVIVVVRDSTVAHALAYQRLLLRVVATGAIN